MFYNARWYDPALGRFAQADTYVPGVAPIAFDRYAYVLNSPVRYIDLSGHHPCSPQSPRSCVYLFLYFLNASVTIDMYPPTGAGTGGIGTVIGDTQVITTSHFASVTAGNTDRIDVFDRNGNKLSGLGTYSLEWDDRDNGPDILLLTTPDPLNSLTVQVASQQTINSIQPGDYLYLVYENDDGHLVVGIFKVVKIMGGKIYVDNNDLLRPGEQINHGDSGGGAFLENQLVGVIEGLEVVEETGEYTGLVTIVQMPTWLVSRFGRAGGNGYYVF